MTLTQRPMPGEISWNGLLVSVERAGAGWRWDAAGYARNARFVADLGSPILELLDPRPQERILDVGCGDGAFSTKLVEAGAVVVGIDSSPELVAAARSAGIDARLMDARDIAFDGSFDAVASNAALHWVLEPERVVQGVARVLAPGGRFVAELGGHGNVAAIRTALAAVLDARGFAVAQPWFFPSVEDYTRLLELGGFAVKNMELVSRPTPLPTGLPGWLSTFAKPFVDGLDAGARDEVFRAVVRLLEPILKDSSDRWTADYVRLRFAAIRTDRANVSVR